MKSFIAGGLFVAKSLADEQPSGVSDPYYYCDQNSSDVQLNIWVQNHENVCVCGRENGESVTYASPADFTEAPFITMSGSGVKLDALYTVMISNPDNIIPIKPILHSFVGNISGERLVAGDLSAGYEVFHFHAPKPPTANHSFHYCYMLYEQAKEEDFTSVASMDDTKFPIQAIAEKHNLKLLSSNFFAAHHGDLNEAIQVV